MKRCPRCSEEIGDETRCPFCKTVITPEALEKDRLKIEGSYDQKLVNGMAEHKRRNKYMLIIFIISAVVLIGGTVLITSLVISFDLNLNLLFLLLPIELGIYLFGLVKFKIGLCPYCNSFLRRRSMFFSNYCDSCGGRLK